MECSILQISLGKSYDREFFKDNFFGPSDEVLNFQLVNLYPIRVRSEQERVNLIFLSLDDFSR